MPHDIVKWVNSVLLLNFQEHKLLDFMDERLGEIP